MNIKVVPIVKTKKRKNKVETDFSFQPFLQVGSKGQGAMEGGRSPTGIAPCPLSPFLKDGHHSPFYAVKA